MESIFFAGSGWAWVALAAAVVLVPLAWLAARPGQAGKGTVAVALALRTLGVGLLLLCLLDPQWVTPRAKAGANYFAVLADNSQGLQVSDNGTVETRGAQLRQALTEPGDAWLTKLGEEFKIRPYLFDRDLRRVWNFNDLDFQGERTALGSALKKVRERFTGQPLAGVLLFTDGIATDLPEGVPDTNGLPPIYPVLVGKPEPLRDISIGRIDLRQTAFDDAPVTLHAEVAGQGAANQVVEVTVKPAVPAPPGAREPDDLPPAKTVRLQADGQPVEADFDWHPRGAGVQFYEVSVAATGETPVAEATALNNHRIVMVDRGRPAYRILYVAGRPDWDFKFLNRALADDPQLQLVSLIRIARREPKFEFLGRTGEISNPLFRGFQDGDDTQRYDQPVLERLNTKDEKELASGFPHSAEELFQYDAIIVAKLEAEFFTPDQLALIRRFVAERGGGFLMMGGAESLEMGNYAGTLLANALPVYLDRRPDFAATGNLTWKLTREGWLEPWTRIRLTEDAERTRIRDMQAPFNLLNVLYGIKPGATVLVSVEDEAGHTFPGLVAQNYGAGRSAVLAIGNLWRWGMAGVDQHADMDHFWRQLARWMVTEVPPPVEIHLEPSKDEGGGVLFKVIARDKEFHPLDLASVKINIKRVTGVTGNTTVGFTAVTIPAEPVVDKPGQYTATFAPHEPGAYVADAEVADRAGEAIGRAQTGWVNDPAAEEFRSLTPNRTLMEELARRTGGEVIDLTQLDKLVESLPKRSAPITESKTHPLWDQSWMFLAVLGCFVSEWVWRRWRGLP